MKRIDATVYDFLSYLKNFTVQTTLAELFKNKLSILFQWHYCLSKGNTLYNKNNKENSRKSHIESSNSLLC